MNQLLTKKTIAKIQRGEMTVTDRISVNTNVDGKKSFAQKQMEKMGWVEGQGLGKDNTGMTKSIAVKKKDSATGLGLNNDAPDDMPDNWWNNAFAANLKGFREKLDDKKSKKDRKKSSKKEKEDAQDNPTYDELFKATGGARLGMRARADQKGKLRRTEELDDKDKDKKNIGGDGKDDENAKDSNDDNDDDKDDKDNDKDGMVSESKKRDKKDEKEKKEKKEKKKKKKRKLDE